MLVVGKEANIHCTESQTVLKTGQEKLYPPTKISLSLAAVSPTPTFDQVYSLQNIVYSYFRRETELWKIM